MKRSNSTTTKKARKKNKERKKNQIILIRCGSCILSFIHFILLWINLNYVSYYMLFPVRGIIIWCLLWCGCADSDGVIKSNARGTIAWMYGYGWRWRVNVFERILRPKKNNRWANIISFTSFQSRCKQYGLFVVVFFFLSSLLSSSSSSSSSSSCSSRLVVCIFFTQFQKESEDSSLGKKRHANANEKFNQLNGRIAHRNQNALVCIECFILYHFEVSTGAAASSFILQVSYSWCFFFLLLLSSSSSSFFFHLSFLVYLSLLSYFCVGRSFFGVGPVVQTFSSFVFQFAIAFKSSIRPLYESLTTSLDLCVRARARFTFLLKCHFYLPCKLMLYVSIHSVVIIIIKKNQPKIRIKCTLIHSF